MLLQGVQGVVFFKVTKTENNSIKVNIHRYYYFLVLKVEQFEIRDCAIIIWRGAEKWA